MRSARVVSSVTMTRFSRSRETPRGRVPTSMPVIVWMGRDRRTHTAADPPATRAIEAINTQVDRFIANDRSVEVAEVSRCRAARADGYVEDSKKRRIEEEDRSITLRAGGRRPVAGDQARH